MQHMKILIFLVLFLVSQTCYAGGDFVLGRIAYVFAVDEEYTIRFTQTELRPELMKGCKDITVNVSYSRVPWYSWLPFINSGHPDMDQHTDAVQHLIDAQKSKKEIYFGYIGGGLISVEEPCTFASKGLSLTNVDGKLVVFSFHDEI